MREAAQTLGAEAGEEPASSFARESLPRESAQERERERGLEPGQ